MFFISFLIRSYGIHHWCFTGRFKRFFKGLLLDENAWKSSSISIQYFQKQICKIGREIKTTFWWNLLSFLRKFLHVSDHGRSRKNKSFMELTVFKIFIIKESVWNHLNTLETIIDFLWTSANNRRLFYISWLFILYIRFRLFQWKVQNQKWKGLCIFQQKNITAVLSI